MMMNLFSMFDPASSSLNLNWWVLAVPIILFNKLFFQSTKISTLKMNLSSTLESELKKSLAEKSYVGTLFLLIGLFSMLAITNLLTLLPFVFSSTAHIMLNFPLALSMWLGMMFYGWTKNFKKMLIHLVPTGTPPALMFFMVLIEMVSSLIRPITLSVRLTANLIAGHLLIHLLNSLIYSSFTTIATISWSLLILTSLELAVALIQGYVFMTLISLYSNEMH